MLFVGKYWIYHSFDSPRNSEYGRCCCGKSCDFLKKKKITRYLRVRTEQAYPKCLLIKNLSVFVISILEFKCETRRKKRGKSGVRLARAPP